MDASLLDLPLAQRHAESGARFAPFAGYNMPMQYADGIIAEHNAVRSSVGLFDVSHMGEIRITGARAVEVVDHLVSANIAETEDGHARYCVMCDDSGGIVDDLIVYKIDDEDIWICVNASRKAEDFAFMQAHAPGGATITNESDAWAQLALQGQDAFEVLAPLASVDVYDIEPFCFEFAEIAGVRVMIARTGYTGEDGFELYIPADQAEDVFDRVVAGGMPLGMVLCGLGARDTLRLEAKLALYGQDITLETNPFEAGLAFTVDLDKATPFVGQDALKRIKAEGVTRRLRAFKLQGRGVPRPGYEVFAEDTKVGSLTSGGFAPTLNAGIAMGYVDLAHAKATTLDIAVRQNRVAADVSARPFFKRQY